MLDRSDFDEHFEGRDETCAFGRPANAPARDFSALFAVAAGFDSVHVRSMPPIK